MLTEDTVEASDRRAQFVGIEAYEAAGGIVMRDLFDEHDGGWLQDPGLLDRLVTEKLKAAAAEIAAEGWKWINVAVQLPVWLRQRHAARRGHGVLNWAKTTIARREALRTEQRADRGAIRPGRRASR